MSSEELIKTIEERVKLLEEKLSLKNEKPKNLENHLNIITLWENISANILKMVKNIVKCSPREQKHGMNKK